MEYRVRLSESVFQLGAVSFGVDVSPKVSRVFCFWYVRAIFKFTRCLRLELNYFAFVFIELKTVFCSLFFNFVFVLCHLSLLYLLWPATSLALVQSLVSFILYFAGSDYDDLV